MNYAYTKFYNIGPRKDMEEDGKYGVPIEVRILDTDAKHNCLKAVTDVNFWIVLTTRSRCYKNYFYNLQMFKISQSVCPWKDFPA